MKKSTKLFQKLNKLIACAAIVLGSSAVATPVSAEEKSKMGDPLEAYIKVDNEGEELPDKITKTKFKVEPEAFTYRGTEYEAGPALPESEYTLRDKGLLELGYLNLSKEGNFSYKITQIPADQEGFSYDNAAFHLVFSTKLDPVADKIRISNLQATSEPSGSGKPQATADDLIVKATATRTDADGQVHNYDCDIIEPEADDPNLNKIPVSFGKYLDATYVKVKNPDVKGRYDITITWTDPTGEVFAGYPRYNTWADPNEGGNSPGTYDMNTRTESLTAWHTIDPADKEGEWNYNRPTLFALFHIGYVVPTITFTNNYKKPVEPDPNPVTLTPTITKKIDVAEGSEQPAESTFTFDLKENGETIQTKQINGEGTLEFDPIEYKAEGSYEYTISEEKGTDENYKYDDTVYALTFDVAKAGDSLTIKNMSLKADGKDADGIVFTNEYNKPAPEPAEPEKPEPTPIPDPDPITVAVPSVEKKIAGDTPSTSQLFTFEMKANDEAFPAPSNATASVRGAGTAKFGDITFDKAGVYTYTIQEQKGSDAKYDYDDSVYTLTYTVDKTDDNKLTAAPSVSLKGSAADGLVFINTYHKPQPQPVTISLPNIVKKIDGDKPTLAEKFSFTLIPEDDDNPMPEKDKFEIDGEGLAEMGEITFTKAGTYTYKLSENRGENKDYIYDTSEYTLVYEVTELGDGLVARAAIQKDGKAVSNITFTNTYTTPKAPEEKPADPTPTPSAPTPTPEAPKKEEGQTNLGANPALIAGSVAGAAGIAILVIAIVALKKKKETN